MRVLRSLHRSLTELEISGFRANLVLIHPEDLKEIRTLKQYQSYPEAQPRLEWSGQLVGTLAGIPIVSTALASPYRPDIVLTAGSTLEILKRLKQSRKILREMKGTLTDYDSPGLFSGLWSRIRNLWK